MSEQDVNSLRQELKETRELLEEFKTVVASAQAATAGTYANPLVGIFSALRAEPGSREVSLENFRVKLAEYLNNLKEPYIVTKYGDPLAVVVPYKLYRSMLLELTDAGAQEVMDRPRDLVFDSEDDDETSPALQVNEP